MNYAKLLFGGVGRLGFWATFGDPQRLTDYWGLFVGDI